MNNKMEEAVEPDSYRLSETAETVKRLESELAALKRRVDNLEKESGEAQWTTNKC